MWVERRRWQPFADEITDVHAGRRTLLIVCFPQIQWWDCRTFRCVGPPQKSRSMSEHSTPKMAMPLLTMMMLITAVTAREVDVDDVDTMLDPAWAYRAIRVWNWLPLLEKTTALGYRHNINKNPCLRPPQPSARASLSPVASSPCPNHDSRLLKR